MFCGRGREVLQVADGGLRLTTCLGLASAGAGESGGGRGCPDERLVLACSQPSIQSPDVAALGSHWTGWAGRWRRPSMFSKTIAHTMSQHSPHRPKQQRERVTCFPAEGIDALLAWRRQGQNSWGSRLLTTHSLLVEVCCDPAWCADAVVVLRRMEVWRDACKTGEGHGGRASFVARPRYSPPLQTAATGLHAARLR
jgi:hypothetical protein